VQLPEGPALAGTATRKERYPAVLSAGRGVRGGVRAAIWDERDAQACTEESIFAQPSACNRVDPSHR
jgi:hypothetical protein